VEFEFYIRYEFLIAITTENMYFYLRENLKLENFSCFADSEMYFACSADTGIRSRKLGITPEPE
jgi:hypothetical protein